MAFDPQNLTLRDVPGSDAFGPSREFKYTFTYTSAAQFNASLIGASPYLRAGDVLFIENGGASGNGRTVVINAWVTPEAVGDLGDVTKWGVQVSWPPAPIGTV